MCKSDKKCELQDQDTDQGPIEFTGVELSGTDQGLQLDEEQFTDFNQTAGTNDYLHQDLGPAKEENLLDNYYDPLDPTTDESRLHFLNKNKRR